MKITETDTIGYSRIFRASFIPYNTPRFNLLNSYKCDNVKFLLFTEEDQIIGLIAGIEGNKLLVPFSAPYSCFSFQNNFIKTSYILDAIKALDQYCVDNAYRYIKFTLPPTIYNEHIISKMVFGFCRNDYTVVADDNHVFYTKNYINYEKGTIKKGVRHNVRAASKAGLTFRKAESIKEYKIIYDVIKTNKEVKNRKMGLTLEQIQEMNFLVDIDYFLISLEEKALASAIVYKYSSGIVQIIYWGDLPGYNSYYPMNFLAMNIFRYYYENQVDIIDLGNSSNFSEPNFGLSNFKESIGCTTTIKFTFIKKM